MIRIINTIKEYDENTNDDKYIINSKIINEISDKRDKKIYGVYIDSYENQNQLIDIITFINYYKPKKVIINGSIKYMKRLISLIDGNIEVEIELPNNMSEDDMNRVYEFISSSDRKVGICAKIVDDELDKIFKTFRSFIKTINVDDCVNKDKCIRESKIIHFNGDLICSDDNITVGKKDINNDKTFPSLLRKYRIQNPNKELFTFVDYDNPLLEISYTHKEFTEKVDEAAKALIKMGVRKGSHVALWMNSIPEWFINFYAITKIGAIVVPINKDNREYDMEHILKANDIDVLIMTNGHKKNRYMDTIKTLIPNINKGEIRNSKFPHLKNIVTIGFNEQGCTSYEDYIESGKTISNEILYEMEKNVCNDDVAIILPTSGTTGRPKGVMLTHKSIIRNGTYIGDNLELDDQDTMGIIVTMFHCFGVTLSMTAAMTHNSRMVIPAYYKSYPTIELIHKYNITCLNGAPKHFEGLLDSYNSFLDKTNQKITSLKKGIMAGANCSPKLMAAVEKAFRMKTISVYGQTELAPGDTMSSVSDDEYIRHNTVGRKFDYVDLKIVDDNNNAVPEGQIGEIVVKSPDTMVGYYGDLVATREMFDKDNYFHSGDLAIKEGNCYKIVGRKKNMIIKNGENIQPMEVEEAIRTIPGVKEVCVFGVNTDDSKNQAVLAAIVSDDPSLTSEIIIEILKRKIAGYKIPSKIYFVKKLAYNSNGKIVIQNQERACEKIEQGRLVNVLKKILINKAPNSY